MEPLVVPMAVSRERQNLRFLFYFLISILRDEDPTKQRTKKKFYVKPENYNYFYNEI